MKVTDENTRIRIRWSQIPNTERKRDPYKKISCDCLCLQWSFVKSVGLFLFGVYLARDLKGITLDSAAQAA